MDVNRLRHFLKRERRAKTAIDRCVQHVEHFETRLTEISGKELDQAGPKDLEKVVEVLESQKRGSAKTYLWALKYYYRFAGNIELAECAAQLREGLMDRKPFKIESFRGVDPIHVEKLAAVGIHDVAQMRLAGASPAAREALAERTGVRVEVILEITKLSDLARVAGLKSIRARLYYDGGIDTLDKLASWDPEEMRAMLTEFVNTSGFDGIPPTPKEAAGAVSQARKLPRIVDYGEEERIG